MCCLCPESHLPLSRITGSKSRVRLVILTLRGYAMVLLTYSSTLLSVVMIVSITSRRWPTPANSHNNNTWATDGSMIPAASTISDPKHVTAAATGPATLVLRLSHRNASILQGEQMGLIIALVLAESPPQIYTDHLNSTMLIDDSSTAVNQERRLRSMNGRSYYSWILDLATRKSATITYTKAHTAGTSLDAALNREADHYASSAQKVIPSIPIA